MSVIHIETTQLLKTTMETLGQGEDGADVNKKSWHQLPAEEDLSQFLGQTSGLLEADCLKGITLHSERQMATIGNSSVQPTSDRFESLQLELQDSCLSPALTLIPQGKAVLTSESTLLHQTDLEFAPLRGSPDLSIASERFSQISRLDVDGEANLTHRSNEPTSLSQHHFGVMSTILEDASSCCSLSQHSLSPSSNYHLTQVHDEHSSGLGNCDEWQKEREEPIDVDSNRTVNECGLNSSVPICSFQKLLETDLGVASSSTVPSSSGTALSQPDALLGLTDTAEIQIKHTLDHKQDHTCTSTKKPHLRSFKSREQPQGGSSSMLSQRSLSLSSRLSAISNITVRSSSKQTDATIGLPLGQHQHHSDSALFAPVGGKQTENKNTTFGQNITPASEGSVYVAGPQRALWSSGSHQAADGSFLTSQPVFQSTPSVLLGRGAPAPGKLSPVYSHQDTVAASTQDSSPKPDDIPPLTLSTTSRQSIAEITLQHRQQAASSRLDVPIVACDDTPLNQPALATVLPTSDQQLKDWEITLSAGRVHSLPSLSYVQKVDAWKTNQSTSRSFYDNLSLQGFNGVSSTTKEQNSLSEAIQQQSQHCPNKTSLVLGAKNSTSQTGMGIGVLSCPDVEEAGRAVGYTSPSPFTHSYSHSSLGTVITPIQQEELHQNPAVCTETILPGLNSTAAESSPSGTNNQNPADGSETGPLKTPAVYIGDRYSLNTNMLSSSPGGCHVEERFQASLGASSVISLEVDNYAPHWTSRPGSPPHPTEFNIEDRIPLYLQNLGIDQSPSTILNPFTPRGPIREPEFSPTDLCTIKGSAGTPSKSIQPSDGDSLQKETFSSSSVLSAESSASLTQVFIQRSIQQPARPASSGSVRLSHFEAGTLPESHIPSYSIPQGADTCYREGSYGLPAQKSRESTPAPATWDSVNEGDLSLVGSGTLQEIRRLLGHAESLVSGQLSMAYPGSYCYSENDASFLSPRQNTQAYQDDSCLSVDGKISLLLAHSSSDSALKESSSSSSGPLELCTKSDLLGGGPSTPSPGREENPKSRDICVAPRRAEPEGCSAADPDRAGPVSMLITQSSSSSTSDGQQQYQDHKESAGIDSSEISPAHSQKGAEMGILSEASSEHSLAFRVAKLLQSESSVSVVTSRSSTIDPDESQAREWIMMTVSGSKCEALELNTEDRRRIEEIKRELLLHTKNTKSSSDSESSTQSTFGTVPQPAVGFAAVRSAKDCLTEQPQRVSRIPIDSGATLHTPLEDGVSQTAIKEGRNLEHVPSFLSASQCLRTQNSHATPNDIVLLSNSYSTLRSEEWQQPSQMTKHQKNEGGTLEKDKEVRSEDEHSESEKDVPLPISEAGHTVVRGKRELPSGLELGSGLDHNPHLSSSHLTPSVVHTFASNSHSYPELQTGSRTHHSHSLNTSREVPLTVSSTTEEQQASISTETRLSKDRNAVQGQNTQFVNGYTQISSRHTQAFTSPQRLHAPSRPLLVNTADIPTLLPYKPHGSSELFYMPHAVPELSPNHSETTVESSHPGSDDAVPPQFTPEVLGSRELMDNNVTSKHKEGIYSKRAKLTRGSTLSVKDFHDQRGNTGPLGFRKSVPKNEQKAEQIEEIGMFIPLHMEADYSTTELHPVQSVQKHNLGTETLPQTSTKTIREKEQVMKTQELGVEIGSSLDQMWRRFNEQSGIQDARPTNDIEMSLLERLERLSRLLHGSSSPHTPKRAHCREKEGKNRRREHETLRIHRKDAIKKDHEKERQEVRGVPKTAWENESISTQQTLVEKEEHEKEDRCPAERDESASVSVESSSNSNRSTIDTQRLIRVFGRHRVSSGREAVAESQTLKPSDGMLKLHNTIKKQKRGHGKGSSENHLVSFATEISNTNDTMTSETLSSSSTYTLPFQKGIGRTTTFKRAKVKLVNRSIQAGDLEIVVNGTRRDTRDVGTTFPSPGSARLTMASSGASGEVKASTSILGAASVPVQSHPMQRRQALSKPTCYSNGLSWIVSADELKWDVRKENKPQIDAGQAWFEPYTRTKPWREPLRERQIQVERQTSPEQKTQLNIDCGIKPSALIRLSLQEALALRRPEFVSRSRERMKRLCLLVEERKMQAIFNQEREEIFNRPLTVQQPKAGPAPPPLPSKRVIPTSEMIQRSKRIYAQLPEVQKRKEEEKRKAEYNTYRLKAQLFNKKITNHVLGRRVPWQ